MKIYFNLNSQRIEKNELFSQETSSFQTLGNNTMIIADNQDMRISSFQLLVAKLWLKHDDGLRPNHP